MTQFGVQPGVKKSIPIQPEVGQIKPADIRDMVNVLNDIKVNTSPLYSRISIQDIWTVWDYSRIDDSLIFRMALSINDSITLRLPPWLENIKVRITRISLFFDNSNSRDVYVDFLTSYSSVQGYERIYGSIGNKKRSIIISFGDEYKIPSQLFGGIKVSTSNGTSSDKIGITVYLMTEKR